MFFFFFDENKSAEVENRLANRRDELSASELRGYIAANLINGIELDTPIYRICSYSSLMQTLEKQQLRFSRPSSWDDPYENYFLRYKVDVDGEQVKLKDLERNIFAQCWSLESESDGLWRNFGGKNKFSVQIESTVWDIMKELYDVQTTSPSKMYYCGKVNYVPANDIENELRKPIRSSLGKGWSLRRAILQTLMTKRLPFEYEKEVRFVFIRPSMSAAGQAVDRELAKNRWNFNHNEFYVKFTPVQCIKQIKIAPWIDKKTTSLMEQTICSYGFKPSDISQSTLYYRPGVRIKG